MSDRSKIEWTDATWNPIIGCSRVSAGCQNCYAERHAYRFARQAGSVFEGTAKLVNGKPTFTGRLNSRAEVLDQPLRWQRPRRVFVNSMSDLFHHAVPDTFIAAVFGIMAATPRHTYQVLTKRPERALRWFQWMEDATEAKLHECLKGAMGCHHPKRPAINTATWPLPNVWLGVSVEDQAAADARIPLLLQTPAWLRFLSCEPLLGPINLQDVCDSSRRRALHINCIEAKEANPAHAELVAALGADYPYSRIDWVIAGGESGPGARPMHPDWARSLRDQCSAAGVPFFFKQWGEWAPAAGAAGITYSGPPLNPDRVHWLWPDGRHEQVGCGNVRDGDSSHLIHRVGKKHAGRTLDGAEHNAFPEPRA